MSQEPTTPVDPPLLSATAACIEVDGGPGLSRFELCTHGDRLLLVGSTVPLVAAIAGVRPHLDNPLAEPQRARVTSGTLAVLGRDVARGDHRRVCGVALSDPPLPTRWTVREYLAWCARLDGASRRAVKALVASALQTLSLNAIATTRLSRLSGLERRVVVLAGAIVSQPAAMLVDDPFAGLEPREAALMLGALGRAGAGRGSIVSVPRLRLTDPTSELATSASDICVLRDGTLVLHDSPVALLSAGRLFEVTVLANVEAFTAALAEEGLTLRGGPHHFSITLPERCGPSTVLRAAARARAPVTSCLPLVG